MDKYECKKPRVISMKYFHTEEAKEKIRKARTGVPHTDETKEKLRLAHRGKILPDEQKRKMSESHRARWARIYAMELAFENGPEE